MGKKIKFNTGYVATRNNILEEGETYQYKEGTYIVDVKLLGIYEDDTEWSFKFYVPEEKRECKVSFVKEFQDSAYYGMWNFTDAGKYDILKVKAYREKQLEKYKNIEFPVLDISEFEEKRKEE